MSTQAFGARRVSRSLREIARYLDEGIKVAGGIPPGQTVRLDLDPAPVTLTPRITNVSWLATGTSVLKLPQPNPVEVLVLGDDLTGADSFKIVSAVDNSTFEAHEIRDNTDERFKAKINLQNPTPGSYHAVTTNDAGQTVLRQDACRIEAAATPTPTPTPSPQPQPQPQPQPPGLQLGNVIPNHGIEGMSFHAVLLVLRGTPTRFYFTDLDGKRQQWTVEAVGQNDYGDHYGMASDALRAHIAETRQLHKDVDLVFLRIRLDSPQEKGKDANAKVLASKLRPRMFWLVAESDAPKGEDKLAFEVVQQPKGQVEKV